MLKHVKMQISLLVLTTVLIAFVTGHHYHGCKKYCHNRRSPKCGSNGVTYTNRCHFQNAKCEDSSLYMVGHGACQQSGAIRQARMCLNTGGGSDDSDSGEPMFVRCSSSSFIGGNHANGGTGVNGGNGANGGTVANGGNGVNGGTGPNGGTGDNGGTGTNGGTGDNGGTGTNGGTGSNGDNDPNAGNNGGGNVGNGNQDGNGDGGDNNNNGNSGNDATAAPASGNVTVGNGRYPDGDGGVTAERLGDKTTAQPAKQSTDNACPETCPLAYEPVCGSDDSTYPNECTLNSVKCLTQPDLFKVKDGECQTEAGLRGDI